MKTVKCPFCKEESQTDKKYVYCDTCGNGYKAKNNEVEK